MDEELRQLMAEIRDGVSSLREGQESLDQRMEAVETRQAEVGTEIENANRLREEQGSLIETVQTELGEIRGRTAQRGISLPGVDEGKEEFSFARAIRGIATGDWQGCEFEREVFKETRSKALAAGTDSEGGHIVPTQYVAQLIEMVRAESIAMQLGVTHMPGLIGSPVEIPKQTGGATGYWVAENASITSSDQTFGQIQMHPKQAAAMTKLSNRLLRLSNPAADQIVRQDLALTLALLVDLAIMKGTGADGQPLGVANHPDKQTASLATIGTNTVSKLVTFTGKLETANLYRGNLGWAFHPTGRQLLAKQLDSNGRPLFYNALEPGGQPTVKDTQLLGHPAKSSTQLAATDAIFGNWADAVLGEWGNMEIRASQETSDAFAKNQTWVRIIREVDVGVREGASFVYVSDLAA